MWWGLGGYPGSRPEKICRVWVVVARVGIGNIEVSKSVWEVNEPMLGRLKIYSNI